MNNFPGIKGKELFLAQGLITPATPYSEKEMGDSPQKILRSGVNMRPG